MADYNLVKVNLANPISAPVQYAFQLKKADEPESAWVTLSASESVEVDGMLTVPLAINGLDANTLYYIRGGNTCESPIEYNYTQQFMTPE